MEQDSQVLNIILGAVSLLALISGFLIPEYQIPFWSIGSALLIVVVLSYYVADNRRKISNLINSFNKIEQSLNIYNRLNKLELKIKKMKRGQIDLLDIIKIGIAIILFIVFYNAIKSLL